MNDLENRKHFTLVRSASMLNITNIYAGGHHSWLIIDNISPERMDFEIPSPLDFDNFSADNSPKNKNSSSNNITKVNLNNLNNFNNIYTQPEKIQTSKINNNIKFNLDLLNEKLMKLNNKVSLQVAYTDLKMVHRFVRFSITSNKENIFKELNSAVSDFYQDDPCVVLFRLQDDSDVNFKNMNPSVDAFFKDFKTSLKLLDNINSGILNKKSFSLTIIYDYKKNESMSNLKNSIESIKIQNEILKRNFNKSLCKIIL